MVMPLVIAFSVAVISIACVITAAYLLWHSRKGWGWFLLVAFLVAASLPKFVYLG